MTERNITPEQHAEFQKELIDSKPSVIAVATWLRERGYRVTVPEISVTPTADQWRQHSDDGDLTFTTPNGDRFLGEVKHLKRHFGIDNWPKVVGPHYLVDNVSTFDRKDPKPNYYFHVNQDYTCIAVLNVAKTWGSWYKHDFKHGNSTRAEHACYCARWTSAKFFLVGAEQLPLL